MHALRLADVRQALPGAVAGLAWLALRRKVDTVTVVLAGVTAAAGAALTDRWPTSGELTGARVTPSVVAALLVGLALLRGQTAGPAWVTSDGRRTVAIAIGVSAGATWTAVPETSSVVLVGAVLGVLALAVALGLPATWPALGLLAAAIPLAAIWGTSHDGLAAAGAAASIGMLVWWPVGQMVRAAIDRSGSLGGLSPGWWLLLPHLLVALAAARWVGAARDATWPRLALVALVGTAVAAVTRPAATMER